jgi:hypothetical protein
MHIMPIKHNSAVMFSQKCHGLEGFEPGSSVPESDVHWATPSGLPKLISKQQHAIRECRLIPEYQMFLKFTKKSFKVYKKDLKFTKKSFKVYKKDLKFTRKSFKNYKD